MRTVLVATLIGAAALSAGVTNSADAWSVFDKSLADSSADRRQEAVVALATLSGSNSEAVKRAEAALHDKEWLVRESAALALGQMNARDAAPALKDALGDDTPEVAFAAAKALTALGDPTGRDVLVAVLVGERKDAPGMMTNAGRKAKDKLRHPESLLLMGASEAGGAMFGPAGMVVPVVKNTMSLKGKTSPGRASAAAWLAKDPDPYAITLLEWALNDDDQMVRMEAARALGERGNAGSIEKLQPLLADQHTFVRVMAAAAIIRINDRNGEPGGVPAGPVTPATIAKH